ILNGRLVDAFTNIMAVKLFDSGHRENDFVRAGMNRYLDAVKGLTRSITSVRSAVAILNGFMMAAVFWLAIRGWMAGSATTGEIAAAVGHVFRHNQMSGYMMLNIDRLIESFATVHDATGTLPARPERADAPDTAGMQAAPA